MPAPFIAAVSAIGASVGSAALIMGAVEIGTALFYATYIAGMSAYSSHQKRKQQRAARDAYNASLQDRLVMVANAQGARSRVYGKVRNVDGVLFKATRGTHSEFYTLVVALAGNEVHAIDEVYFDDEVVTLDGSGWVVSGAGAKTVRETGQVPITINSAGNGSVVLPHTPLSWHVVGITGFDYPGSESSLAAWATLDGSTVTVAGSIYGAITARVTYEYERTISKARVRKFLGGPGQDLSSAGGLVADFPDLVTSADKFQGIACLRVDLEYDTDAWPTGVPSISAVVRGAKVFDPRTSTTAWSENPALIARDWSLHSAGGNLTSAQIDDASFIAAANACDVVHGFVSTSGTTNRPLYTCGIVCPTDQDPSMSLDEIIESMAGRSGYSGGRLRVRAGAYRAPVATITDDWLSGAEAITIVPEPPADEAVNVVRPTIADAAQNYTVVPSPPIRATAYIAADGRELPVTLDYGGVTDTDHAQHVAGANLRESRSGLACTLPCNLRALQLELFDVVNVTLSRYGWVNKLMEVTDWRFSMQGGVVLGLRETAASIFDPDALFASIDATPNTALPNPRDVESITGLSVADDIVRQADGSIITIATVTWNAIEHQGIRQSGRIEVQYFEIGGEMPAGDWPMREEAGDATISSIAGLTDGRYYLVRARARNSLGVRGKWSASVLHFVAGKTTPPPDVTHFKLIEQPGGVRQFFWDYPDAPADLMSFEVRYTPGSTIYEWGDMPRLFAKDRDARQTETTEPIGDGVYTFAIRAIDTTGNASAPAYITEVLDGDAFGVVESFVLPHQERWPGTRTDCFLSGGDLTSAGAASWGDFDVAWGSTDELWGNTGLSPIGYEHPVVDLGVVASRSIRASSMSIGAASVEYASSGDDVTYSAWAPIPATPIEARYFKFRWTVTGTDPRLLRAQVVFYI